MRHLFGIVFGAAMAAALFAGGGWGFQRLTTLTNSTTPHLTSIHALTALAALGGTGLLLGVLMAAPRVSPLATALPGVAALAATAMYAASPHRTVDLIPMRTSTLGTGAHTLLATGIYALFGIAMLIPVFVPSRWRRLPGDEEEEPIGMATASNYLS